MTTFNRLNSANYKLSDDNIACICNDYLAGYCMDDIANEYRVAKTTVRYWLLKRNVPIRPAGSTASKRYYSVSNSAAKDSLAALQNLVRLQVLPKEAEAVVEQAIKELKTLK